MQGAVYEPLPELRHARVALARLVPLSAHVENEPANPDIVKPRWLSIEGTPLYLPIDSPWGRHEKTPFVARERIRPLSKLFTVNNAKGNMHGLLRGRGGDTTKQTTGLSFNSKPKTGCLATVS